jgi:hypothetical protein
MDDGARSEKLPEHGNLFYCNFTLLIHIATIDIASNYADWHALSESGHSYYHRLTGLFQILNDNKGIGLIFETEGDTLAQTFKSEHGNYSDGFRKAFHHEIISYNRRKDCEFVELETPRLSALLLGTPKQVSTLIPNAENGLFSRFIFYYMNILPVWKDVFVMEIVKVLIQHAAFVFRQLPAATIAPTNNPKMALFQALPVQFDRAKYIEVAAQLQIPESTADKQIARFLSAGLLTRQTHGSYAKQAE